MLIDRVAPSPMTGHQGSHASAPNLIAVKVLIAEARAMAGDTMVRAVNRTEGLSLSSRCVSRSEVARACAVAPPDVAVLDVSLYEHDARLAVASLRELAPQARVLLTVPELDAKTLAQALLAGAENCIPASIEWLGFVQALTATSAGKPVMPPPELQESLGRAIVQLSEDGDRLSVRELDVLRLAATGLPVAGIAAQLFISTNTVRTHLSRSYRKLGAQNRCGAVVTAMRAGMLG